jgi:hypothetical protein
MDWSFPVVNWTGTGTLDYTTMKQAVCVLPAKIPLRLLFNLIPMLRGEMVGRFTISGFNGNGTGDVAKVENCHAELFEPMKTVAIVQAVR